MITIIILRETTKHIVRVEFVLQPRTLEFGISGFRDK